MTDDRIFAKCAWRLLPLLIAAYVVNYLDRTNIGFAALTMNKDLAFSPSVYGLGAGIFFLSYSAFQVPANLVLHRVGARRWIFCILLVWGGAAAACALIRGPYTFYGLRFLLGVAEAGFFPGIILYLTFWFPKAYLCRVTAIFMAAPPASLVIGGPLATVILHLNGAAGFYGWQWLFLLEGLPACVIAFAVLRFLPDRPRHASWLRENEKAAIAARLHIEENAKQGDMMPALLDVRVVVLGIAYGSMLVAIYGFAFWLPLIVQGMGFSNTATGFVTALLYLAALPAMILWGRSSDRKGERTWHVAIPALFAAAALGVASITHEPLVLLFALALAWMGMESILAPFYTLPALFLSGPAMAAGFALVSAIGGLIGGFAGQYVIGIVRERTGSYALPMLTMATALLLGALVVLALGRATVPGVAAKAVARA